MVTSVVLRGVWRALLGPLPAFRTRWRAGTAGLAAVVLLTLLTQIGGVVLWLSWAGLGWMHGRLRRGTVPAPGLATAAAYALLYAVASVAIVPPVASAFGRERLPCFADDELPLRAVSPLFCVSNRNYARPAVYRVLRDLSAELARVAPGTVTAYLDAGFPFLDGFPMLPHLSHRAGTDVDLAFFYRRRGDAATVRSGGAWPIGYWAYVPARAVDPMPCATRTLDLRWDLPWLQPAFADLALDDRRTGTMLRWLSARAGRYGIDKVLLEPHLQRRLATDPGIVRFQGCRAARHDDHLHLQLR